MCESKLKGSLDRTLYTVEGVILAYDPFCLLKHYALDKSGEIFEVVVESISVNTALVYYILDRYLRQGPLLEKLQKCVPDK